MIPIGEIYAFLIGAAVGVIGIILVFMFAAMMVRAEKED